MFIVQGIDKPIVIYFHCGHGQDRTGEMAGAYELQYLNIPFLTIWTFNTSISPFLSIPLSPFSILYRSCSLCSQSLPASPPTLLPSPYLPFILGRYGYGCGRKRKRNALVLRILGN